ncbi:MAG: T9SS type A sorting domain-containing protein, partial [Candidatus Cloacimonetes bacterium]|nr:T9SS type A sorting domain-containing protein [Candidatus Cloacimonadota bacterium]
NTIVNTPQYSNNGLCAINFRINAGITVQDIQITNNIISSTNSNGCTIDSGAGFYPVSINYNMLHNVSLSGFSANLYNPNNPASFYNPSAPRFNYQCDPQLDANYVPRWNATIMSHCIDTGTGVNDTDGTPPDIGAYPAMSHTREEYAMPTGGTPKWMSFPVLNRITQGYDTTGNFFAPISDFYVLDQVIWKVEDEYPVAMAYHNGELWHGNVEVRSVLGYKINLQPGVTQAIQIAAPGFIQAPNTVINLFAHPAGSTTGVNENWIGYYLPQSSSPFTALASILDKVTSIKTQYWSAIKGNGYWRVSSANLTLNYGDMVVVTVTEDCSFAWSNVTPIDPKVRPKATAFEYVEKLDYMPMFIDLSGFEVLPSEIGLYVDGECKGAVKVEGNYTDLCAYLDKYEVLNPEDCELVLYFETKAMDNIKQSCKLDSHSLTLNNENGIPHYDIAINSSAVINTIVPITGLSPNYPNPFNPVTTISYEIASEGLAKIEIFNLKGQLVKTLVSESKASGPHKVVWNGTDKYGRKVASGLYQYRLTTKEGSITKKMMLMK